MKEIIISSWLELQERIFENSWDNDISRFRSKYAFRGLSNKDYKLESSFTRLCKDFSDLEPHLWRNFKKYAEPGSINSENFWDLLSVAQHHGLPTRLMDWTFSPYVALHFVTDNINEYNKDGAIWCINFDETHKLLPSSLYELLKGSTVFTTEMLQTEAPDLDKLSEKSKDTFVLFFQPPSIDSRIVNQYALFSLISNSKDSMDIWVEKHSDFCMKIIIPSTLKWEIRDKLDQVNITERVLLPGLDGLCQWLKRHYTPTIYSLKDIIEVNLKIPEEARLVFENISIDKTKTKEDISKDLKLLSNTINLTYALLALYRQQVNSGFVLGDPTKRKDKETKRIYDPDTNITFQLQWNPERELRKNYVRLIEKDIILGNVDETMLINKDMDGNPCYLCKDNIDLKFPKEILIPVQLAGEKYYIGANFAYITNNHFTIMSSEHRPQKYTKKILETIIHFVDQANGNFRILFNDLAGASIDKHEHFQVTTDQIPIEKIKIKNEDIIYAIGTLRIMKPKYYIPVWVIEGTEPNKIINLSDRIITAWHNFDEQNHIENIICTKTKDQYRIYIILRDKRNLYNNCKNGPLAAFEVGGYFIFSYKPENPVELNEKDIFDNSTLDTIKHILIDISPASELDLKDFISLSLLEI